MARSAPPLPQRIRGRASRPSVRKLSRRPSRIDAFYRRRVRAADGPAKRSASCFIPFVFACRAPLSSAAPSRDQSTLKPQVRFATVPVIAPARSDARNLAVSATSASLGNRLRRVNPSKSSRKLSRSILGNSGSIGRVSPIRCGRRQTTHALRAKFPSKRAGQPLYRCASDAKAAREWDSHSRR